jgi:hypothetical protein
METGMTTTQRFLGAIMALMITASANAQSAPSPIADVTILLVHGALIDGSSKGSHFIHISHPRAVARVIETAARAVQ